MDFIYPTFIKPMLEWAYVTYFSMLEWLMGSIFRNPSLSLTGGGSAATNTLQNQSGFESLISTLQYVSLAIAFITLLVLIAKFALQRRAGMDFSENIRGLGYVVTGVFLISTATTLILPLIPPLVDKHSISSVQLAQSAFGPYAAIGMLGGMIYATAQMIMHRSLGSLKALGFTYLKLIFTATLAASAVTILLIASDQLTNWILDQGWSQALTAAKSVFDGHTVSTTTHGVTTQVPKIFEATDDGGASAANTGATAEQESAALSGATAGPLVAIAVVFGLLGAIVQTFILSFRTIVLVIMVGLMPLAASLSSFGYTKNWFPTVIRWTIGFLVYKPLAALIIVVGFTLAASQSGGMGFVYQITTLFLALFSLPAIIRVLAPADADGGGGEGVQQAAGVATKAASLAA